MKYIVIPNPTFREFSMIGNQVEMFQGIKDDNFAIIDTSFETSKTISVTLQRGKNRFKGNMYYPGFNFLERSNHSYLTNESYKSFHFKMTKNQGWKEFKLYVETVLKDFLGELPADFEIKYFWTKVITKLTEDCPMYEEEPEVNLKLNI